MAPGLVPMPPRLGPPLPFCLGILWPWLKAPDGPENPATEERKLEPGDRVVLVFKNRIVEEPGDLWIDWENELGGGKAAVWEAVEQLEKGNVWEVPEPLVKVYPRWILELTNRDWREAGSWFGPRTGAGVVFKQAIAGEERKV